MSNAVCMVTPPSEPFIADGLRVYRCSGAVTTENDTDENILYGVVLVIQTSLGHRKETDSRHVIAAPGSNTTGPYFADINASDLPLGEVVTFTCQIGLTGGFTGTNIQTNSVRIV